MKELPVSRLAPTLCWVMKFAPTIQFGTVFGCLKSYSTCAKPELM